MVLLDPPNTLLVEEEQPAKEFLATVKSPKSCALPVDAVVMKSITFSEVGPELPPANNPLVEFEDPTKKDLEVVKSPKSDAFPVDAIVT